MTRAGILTLSGLAMMLWGGCNDREVASGSGSQTTNTIAGVLVDGQGRPQAGVHVRVVREDFNPLREEAFPAVLADTTDGKGRYAVGSLPTGTYALEARHPGSGTGVLVMGIGVSGTAGAMRGRDTLRPTGTLVLPLSARSLQPGGILYVPGTTYRARILPADLEKGEVRIDSLPPGDYPGLRYAQDTSLAGADTLRAGGFQVESGRESVLGPYAFWKASWNVGIDFAAAGAAPGPDLAGFPLFVRLDSGNFDFSLARGDGGDLRFSRADGTTPAAHAIERWDSAGRKADLWVRLDSLSGAAPFLYMYAGNPAATASSPPDSGGARSEVFDTATGFAGVWHLDGILPRGAGDSAALVADATPNGNVGIGVNGAGRKVVEGRTGRAVEFDGQDDYIDLGTPSAFDVGARATLEAWIRPGRLPESTHTFQDAMVLAKFDAYSLEIQADGTVESWLRTGPAMDPNIIHPPSPLAAVGAWTHLAAVYDGSTLTLYVDGKPASSLPATGAVTKSIHHLIIGYITGWPGSQRYFAGVVDEVRLSKSARPAGWIALEYHNQQQGSTTVTLERLPD